MKTGKKLALAFGLVAGALLTVVAVGRTSKRVREVVSKKTAEMREFKPKLKKRILDQDSEVNYV